MTRTYPTGVGSGDPRCAKTEFLIGRSIERLNSRSLLGGACAKKFASNKIGVKEMASREMHKAVC
ncbi:MAG: hypothetical protein ABC537_02220, partial [Candidatus Methanosuratincola sp.]